MDRLIIKKLIVISQSESRSLEIPFTEGLNIILGGNKTGKSSIIKSIFTTFGCECKRVEKDWQQLISAYILYFKYGSNGFCIVRQGKRFQIFEEIKDDYFCIVETDSFHEYSDKLMNIFGVNIPCVTKDGKEINITPPLLFRFQYIDQDEGWSKIGDSFSNVNYIRDWKKNTNKYVCGYYDDHYYELQAQKARKAIDRDDKNREYNYNKNFISRVSESIIHKDFDQSIEETVCKMENMLVKAEEIRREIYKIKANMSICENEIYVNEQKKQLVEKNLLETEKDIEFAMEQSKEITCPTCGAIYINGLNEQLNISSDYAHCEKLKGELIEKISDATNRLSRYEEEYNKLSNDLQEEEKLIQKSQELLSYSSYYENKGQHEIYESCKKQLEVVKQELNEIVLGIVELDNQINEMKSSKRAKEIRNKIEKNCYEIAQKIHIPNNFVKLRDFVQLIERTGSETPRLVYMYQSALYLYNLDRIQSPFNFYIIDTPNQQGQDENNLESIFKSLELFVSDEGQVIVGTERKTSIENKASNIILLSEERRCLKKDKYVEHVNLLQLLQDKALTWTK